MSEPERNDSAFVEDVGTAFAVYCDTRGLTLAEGYTLADDLQRQIGAVAEEREATCSMAAEWDG